MEKRQDWSGSETRKKIILHCCRLLVFRSFAGIKRSIVRFFISETREGEQQEYGDV